MVDRAARFLPAEVPPHLRHDILQLARALLCFVDDGLPEASREDGSQSFAAYVVFCAVLGVMHGQSRPDTGAAIGHALAQLARKDCPNQRARRAFIEQITGLSVMMTGMLG